MFNWLFGFGMLGAFLIGLLSLVLFIWAIVDIIGQKRETSWKVIWVLVCLFLGVIGIIIYYFVSGRKKGK